jgi:hypothetical protein
MAVNEDKVRIQSPCPVQLDPARAANGVRSWHCGHCDKAVHVLSNMTEPEARAFMADNAGKDICVTYAVRKDGSIRFAPERPVVAAIVPVTALARRRHAAAAAVGLGLALAACAPHDNAKFERPSISVTDTPVNTPTVPVVPAQPPTPVVEPDEQLVDGMMAFEPPPPEPSPIPRAGGLEAMPIADEPCDPPKKADERMVRGRRAPTR